MKKLIFTILLLVGFVAVLPADIISLGQISFLNLSADSKDTFIFMYDTEDNELLMNNSDWHCNANIIFNSELLESFRKTISKTLEWCKVAHDNNAEVDKELPDSTLQPRVEWTWGGINSYRSSGFDPMNLRFLFVSSNGSKGMVTALMMAAPKITSSYSEDVTYRFPQSFITEPEIKKLNKIISQENIDAAIKKREDAKKAEELFN